MIKSFPSQHSDEGPLAARRPFHSGPLEKFFGGPPAVLQNGNLAARQLGPIAARRLIHSGSLEKF